MVIVRFLRVVIAVNEYEDVPAGEIVRIRRATGTSWSLELEQREQSAPSTYIPGVDDITNHSTIGIGYVYDTGSYVYLARLKLQV